MHALRRTRGAEITATRPSPGLHRLYPQTLAAAVAFQVRVQPGQPVRRDLEYLHCAILPADLYTCVKQANTGGMAADTLIKLALAPLFLAQALHVRRKALLLPEPPGPRSGTTGDGPPLHLLILGDSSAAGVGASHQSRALSGQLSRKLAQNHTLHWQVEATTGATSASALRRLEALHAQPFDTVLVVLGVNDVTRSIPLSRFLARRRAIHDLLRTRFGTQTIIASGLPPMDHFPLLPQPLRWTLGRTAARFDAALARLCADEPGCFHLPLDLPFEPRFVAADGFHPSEDAYAHWADMLASRM